MLCCQLAPDKRRQPSRSSFRRSALRDAAPPRQHRLSALIAVASARSAASGSACSSRIATSLFALAHQKLHLLRHQYSDGVGPHVMRCEDRAGVDPGRASSPSSTSQARRSPSTTRQLPHEHAHTDAVGCSLGFVAPRCAGGRVCGLRPDLGRRWCHGVIDARDVFGG